MTAAGPLKHRVPDVTTKGEDVPRRVTIGILALQVNGPAVCVAMG